MTALSADQIRTSLRGRADVTLYALGGSALCGWLTKMREAAALHPAMVLITFGGFFWLGSARVEIRDGVLYAGPAHISLDLVGPPEPLDPEETRRVHGVDADARAFLCTRPYLKRSVLVPVLDAADRTPYWLVSTRHPDRLVAALGGAEHPSD